MAVSCSRTSKVNKVVKQRPTVDALSDQPKSTKKLYLLSAQVFRISLYKVLTLPYTVTELVSILDHSQETIGKEKPKYKRNSFKLSRKH